MKKSSKKRKKKKKTKKKKKKIIPHFNTLITFNVWSPWKVPSRVISRHHWNIVINVINNPKVNKLNEYWWNHLIKPETKVKVLIAPVNGHGL